MKKDFSANPILEESFRKEIKVYLFKYTPEWSIEQNKIKDLKEDQYLRNGDIAIVIDTSVNGLNLHQHKAIPICLPKFIDTTAEISIKTVVTIAGRGERYSETTDRVQKYFPKISSCLTNEGVVQKKSKGLATVQHIFLPCKGYERKHKDNVCISLENGQISHSGKKVSAFKTKSISTTSSIKFFNAPSSFQIESPLNDPSANELCNDYWDKAEQALKREKQDTKINLFEQSDSTDEPDRIVVFDQSQVKAERSWDKTGSKPRLVTTDINWKKVLEEWEKFPSKMGVMCYNLPKLGQFGICKTEKHQYPWGFCSPSCGKTTKFSFDNFENYEEMKAIYHEEFPKDSIEDASGKNNQFVFNSQFH